MVAAPSREAFTLNSQGLICASRLAAWMEETWVWAETARPATVTWELMLRRASDRVGPAAICRCRVLAVTGCFPRVRKERPVQGHGDVFHVGRQQGPGNRRAAESRGAAPERALL